MSRKITQFDQIDSLLPTDLIPAVRTSEINLADRNKKVTIETLIKSLDLPGRLSCQSDCSIGGKVYEVYSTQNLIPIFIKVNFDIQITEDPKAIQVHRWSQEPNVELSGREWYSDLPRTGGLVRMTIGSSTRWISIFALNANTGFYDAVCFEVHGNTITLLGF
jgi:hypothetical protein